MTAPPLIGAAAAALAAAALADPAVPPDVVVIVAFGGVGNLIGQWVGQRRKRRDPSIDAGLYASRWSFVAALFGLTFDVAYRLFGA